MKLKKIHTVTYEVFEITGSHYDKVRRNIHVGWWEYFHDQRWFPVVSNDKEQLEFAYQEWKKSQD